MRYYLLVDRRPAGPFAKDELLARSDFRPDSIVCAVGATSADAWRRAADEPELAGAFRADRSASPAPSGGDPSTRLILLVEDDDDCRSLFESSVKKEGFRVIAAENGRDAATKLEPDAPDLIVTDLMMPGVGGYEFIRALQAAGHGGVPVILVTGAVLDASTVAAMRQDANIVQAFAKPVDISALMNAIHAKLGTRRHAPGPDAA
ncbi:MAG: response regulator [Elusimicrobia bacterium]|nr:response regulator [Elusimicrobiota bacterium]